MDYQRFQLQLPEVFNNWGEAACHPKSDIFQSILTQVNGMISPNVMQLLNFAVSCLDEDEIYCEIGTFPGASLISSLINNPDKKAYAVDDFSELDIESDNLEKLANNIEKFNVANQVFFCYQGFEEFFREFKNEELTDKIGVYFYDASQNYRSYLLGLLAVQTVISPQCIMIITNCQWQSCQQAVRDFVATHSAARLMLDFADEDYLLWNGIQILSWDIYRDLSDDMTLDCPIQESINNITKLEIANFVDSQASKASFLFKNKQYLQAEKIYLNLLQVNKNNANIWHNLGILYYEKGEYLQALDCLNQTLKIDDRQGIYHYTSGLILEKVQIDQAIQAYETAIKLDPNLIDAYNNLGNIFLGKNELDKAEVFFKKAISANPLHFGGHLNLGNLYLINYRNINGAILCYKKAFDLQPKSADILDKLSLAYKLKNCQLESLFYKGFSYFQQGEFEEAIKLYKQVISINPEANNSYLHLLRSLHALGKTKEAIEESQSVLHLLPNNLLIQIASLRVLPPLYQDIEEIEACRKYFKAGLESLGQNPDLDTEINSKNVLEVIGKQTNFYLAYQCQNDVDLQRKYGQIVHQIMAAHYPQWCKDLPFTHLQPGEKIRVGYVSSHLYNHNGANGSLGWIKNHNRQNFQVYCYHVGGYRDEVTEQFRLYSYSFVHMPNDLEAICKQIIIDKLHILVFPAIGMNPIDAQLASLRLAPVQCMGWGHPITSGLSTVDYYLSSELMEPENAQEHYSETLITLPNISICYEKPLLPKLKKTRTEWGIAENSIVYLSCQSTFKYLPQYDYIFPAIAKQVTNAKFLFISAPEGKYITNLFRQRLQKAFAKLGLDSEQHCIILPRQSHDEFLQLYLISDVYLDTLGWNGGFTTLSAIASNLPIVTCPGEFMRGRHSYAFLKMLGITDTIANSEAEYIEIAVKLGLDSHWRYSIAERISQNHHRVFDDKTCVTALEAFYQQVINEKC